MALTAFLCTALAGHGTGKGGHVGHHNRVNHNGRREHDGDGHGRGRISGGHRSVLRGRTTTATAADHPRRTKSDRLK